MMLHFYKEQWHGSFDGSDEELSLLLSRAVDIINNAIAFSGYTVDTAPQPLSERVCKAVCAQADYIVSNGGVESLTDSTYNSASLGKFSYSVDSSGNGNNVNNSSALCPLAEEYLAPTGLLYKGVNVM